MSAARLRATVETIGTLFAALFAFVPFLPRLARSLFTGRRDRERMLTVLRSGLHAGASEPPEPSGSIRHVLLIAGEPSGDLHAADLATALLRQDPTIRLVGLGGPRMEAAGVELVEDLVSAPVMGVLPVLKKLPFFLGLYRRLLIRLSEDPPDVVVGIDYPGLNLRVAKAAKRRGIPFVDYIAPQVWAWAPWRVHSLAASVNRVVTILPFEEPMFHAAGVAASYVGHPLFEHLAERPPDEDYRSALRSSIPEGGSLVALLPGSRSAEVAANLPLMLQAAQMVQAHTPGARFVIALAAERLRPLVEAALHDAAVGGVSLADPRYGDDVMAAADAAITVSGTATLHLVAHGTPAVVIYHATWSARMLGDLLLVSPFIALPNLLSGEEVLPEMIVDSGDVQRIANSALGLMPGGPSRERAIAMLDEVRRRLHVPGAADRAAAWVLATI